MKDEFKFFVEIYRCIEDTLNNEYEMIDKQREMLDDVQTRTKGDVHFLSSFD